MIFRYPGGKSRKSVREKIFNRFPKTYGEYREVMVGGGGIFFSVPTQHKRWINDVDSELMKVYYALRDRPEAFIEICRAIEGPSKDDELVLTKPNGKALYNKRLKGVFDKLRTDPFADRALKYLFVNRTVWAGRVNYDLESRMYFSNPQGWNIVHTKKMEEAATILQDTIITNLYYGVVLDMPGTDVLVYCDPPYVVNTELPKSSRLYKHNFEELDHIALSKRLKECKHKVLLSYDDHPLIRDLYKGWNFGEEEWKYCGSTQKIKKDGKELLITNY